MSPEIKIGEDVIASVIDETGMHQTVNGNPLYVNVDGIDAYNDWQTLILECEEIGGRRVIGLTQEGLGDSADRKRGDGKTPHITVALLDHPIRISYRDKIWHKHTRTLAGPNDGGYYVYSKRTYRNPRWMKGHGGR